MLQPSAGGTRWRLIAGRLDEAPPARLVEVL
jgi:hypothetical protein